METYRVDSVEDAIELARQFKKEGRYDWFRGQLRADWKLQSSLSRAYSSKKHDLDSYKELCGHFAFWVDQNENLKHFNDPNNINLFFAVLQHFGTPTNYIDFTDDPGIAGFFSADGGPEDVSNFESVIYLINTVDIKRFFSVAKEVNPEYDFELVDVKVSNLWRLDAQRGKFIYSNIDWANSFYYPPDRIVFPYTGMPSAPTNSDIYPKIKSDLELQLDQWLFVRRTYENDQLIKSWNSVRFTSLETTEGYKHLIENGVNWPTDEHRNWLNEVKEHFLEIDVRKIQLRVRTTVNSPKYSLQILNGIKAYLDRQPSLRNSAIEWEVMKSEGVAASIQMTRSLNRIWNGMRNLPYSNEHIYAAIQKCVQVLENPQAYDIYNSGETIEFGLPDGSYSRAKVLDSNLLEKISEKIVVNESEVTQWRSRSAAILMQHQDPSILFKFSDFVDLFAKELIPSQIVEERSVVVFNPAKVTVFGLA